MVRADFGSLWSCRQAGESLEISTPYLLPNDDALTVYVTVRDGNRIIVSDGGFLDGFLEDNCDLSADKLAGCLAYFKDHHGIRVHHQSNRPVYYFKEGNSMLAVSSLIFDLGNFVVAVCNAAIPHVATAEGLEEQRFVSKADAYIKTLLPQLEGRKFRKKVTDIPHVRFGGVVYTNSHLWLIGYVTGSTPSAFVHNLSLAHMNFVLARKSSICQMASLVAFVNNDASGYHLDKQAAHLEELQQVTQQDSVKWTERDKLAKVLSSTGPLLTPWTAMSGGL